MWRTLNRLREGIGQAESGHGVAALLSPLAYFLCCLLILLA